MSKPVSFLRLALCCTLLRSRWCQSDVRRWWITHRRFLLKQTRHRCSITLFTEALGRRVLRRSHSPGPTLMSILYLEAAPIGWQLSYLAASRAIAQTSHYSLTSYRPSSKAVGAYPAKEWGVHLSRSTLPLVSPGRTVLPHAILKTHN